METPVATQEAPQLPEGWSLDQRLPGVKLGKWTLRELLLEYKKTVTDNPWISKCRTPHPRQKQFLLLGDIREVFFGGQGGGGKSEALWFGALQYVHLSTYAALILRRTYADLAKPGALMDRSKAYLTGTKAVWNETKKQWRFPSGATITFGHLENEEAKYDFASAEFQYIAFDELTHFTETQYTFLFTRLRKNVTGDGADIPLRMRSASNPGSRGHCVPYGEVLTPTGWKDIKTFSVGDPVFEVDQTGTLIESKVDQVHKSHYTGDMVIAKARGLRMACTPNHKVAKFKGVRGKRDGKLYSLVPFEELPGQAYLLRTAKWVGTHIGSFSVPLHPAKRRLNQPREMTGDLFAEFMGWWLSEGCSVERFKAFDIAQEKVPGRISIEAMLDKIGFKWHTLGGSGYRVHSPDWWDYLRQFGKSRDKFIPQILKDATTQQLEILFKSLMDGDGHRPGWTAAGVYHTISKRLADDFCEIAVKLGYQVLLSSAQQPDRVGPKYIIHFKKNKNGSTELLTGNHIYDVNTSTKRASSIERVPFDGEVYCIGVPKHHAFVIRQDGCVWISGNSWVKKRFVDQKTRKQDAIFIPATMDDNPTLNKAEYLESLKDADRMTREQLQHGNWDAVETGQFKKDWLRYYYRDESGFICTTDGERFLPEQRPCWQTCDPAAGLSENADNFVVSTWCLSPKANMIWLDCFLGHFDIVDQVAHCQRLYRRYRPQFIAVEETQNQRSLAQALRRSSNPAMVVIGVNPGGKRKSERAIPAFILAQSGRLHLPEDNRAFPLEEVEGELLSFTGEDGNRDDTCDSFYYSVQVFTMVSPVCSGSSNGQYIPTWYDPRAPRDPYAHALAAGQ